VRSVVAVSSGEAKGEDMTPAVFAAREGQTAMQAPTKGRHLLGRFQLIGAVVGLAGSVLVVLSGGLLTLAAWLVTNEGVRHWLSTAGSVLLLLTIPLIILAAFCLDWIDRGDSPAKTKGPPADDDDEL
jgi:hypothetical protein